MTSVLRDWVGELTLTMQGTLLTGVRGPDGTPKESPAKEIAKAYRFTIMNPGKPGKPGHGSAPSESDSFMGDWTGIVPEHILVAFLDDHDAYPHHWLMHMFHCAQIVGNFHPNDGIRDWWHKVYLSFCEQFHVNPETSQQFQQRLKWDGPRTEDTILPQVETPICGRRVGDGIFALCLRPRGHAGSCR